QRGGELAEDGVIGKEDDLPARRRIGRAAHPLRELEAVGPALGEIVETMWEEVAQLVALGTGLVTAARGDLVVKRDGERRGARCKRRFHRASNALFRTRTRSPRRLRSRYAAGHAAAQAPAPGSRAALPIFGRLCRHLVSRRVAPALARRNAPRRGRAQVVAPELRHQATNPRGHDAIQATRHSPEPA